MNRIAILPPSDRRIVIQEAAQRLGISPTIVEKDFWVCWMLELIFKKREIAQALVFKGGTSLSKVYGAIQRFSEDIDLSVEPGILGFSDEEFRAATTQRERRNLDAEVEGRCEKWVDGILREALEDFAFSALGNRDDGQRWLFFEKDAGTNSPILWFRYPSLIGNGEAYIRQMVKLELGSLTDQRPLGQHRIQPLLTKVLTGDLSEIGGTVISLEIERTFWEKATLLHAECHRDLEKPMPSRYSRHYADVAALAIGSAPAVDTALADQALCQRVVGWKKRFYGSQWARYDLAKPGTFQLVPPEKRLAELERDYRAMRIMFLEEPPSLAEVISILGRLEARINASR